MPTAEPISIELRSSAFAPSTVRQVLRPWLDDVECAEGVVEDALLVNSLADAWGWEPTAGGKRVWMDVLC